MLDHSIHHLIWRYFTGAHIHGKRLTNAGWLKPGTLPKPHLTWWTRKPRAHRMAYRWGIVAVPIGWVLLFEHYHYWTTLLTIALIPYGLHYAWISVHSGAQQRVRVPLQFESPEDATVTTITSQPTPKIPATLIEDLVFEPLPTNRKKA